jgi:amidase
VLLDAVTDRPQRLAMTLGAGQRRLRIATSTRTPTPTRLAAPVRAVFDQAARTLAGLGHAVTRHDPELGPGLARASSTRYLAGLASDVDDLTDPQSTERRTRTLAAMGRRLSPTMVARARARGDRLGRHMAEFFAETDLLLTPTMPVLPRAADALAGRGLAATLAAAMPCAAFTGPWNACGLPAVSLPMGTGPQGVPIGVQLVGAVGSESLLLAVAAELEPVTAWLERRPRLD